jgi:putative sterol carrier protein
MRSTGKEAVGMETAIQRQWTAERSAPVPSLAGVSGRFRIDIAGRPAGLLEIQDGTVSTRPAAGAEDADAVIHCDDEETVAAFNRGELNPIVAGLQGRMRVEGNRSFAIKVILGLQAAAHPPPESARVLKADAGARKQG